MKSGAEFVDGLKGKDTIRYTNSHDGVIVDLDNGKGSQGYAEGDSYKNIESVWGADIMILSKVITPTTI